jgi:hypothetical protein
MAELVYILCAATSVFCALLLVREYRKKPVKLLLWSSVCFAGLALNNILLFLDVIVVPNVDLSIVRTSIALAAMATLVFGLIWEAR